MKSNSWLLPKFQKAELLVKILSKGRTEYYRRTVGDLEKSFGECSASRNFAKGDLKDGD